MVLVTTEPVYVRFSHLIFRSVHSSAAINLGDFEGNELPHELPSSCHVSLDNLLIRIEKVRNIKSVGPDGLSGSLL